MVGSPTLRQWVLELSKVFEANLERLNSLDQKAGDGDHVTTMLRGLQASAKAVEELPDANAKTILETAASAFRRAAGGASGPLFSSLFSELGKTCGDHGLDLAGFVSALDNAASLVKRLGKAEVGDRTMLDALVPAGEAARSAATLTDALEAAAEAARAGAGATASMIAKKGRARFVNAGQVNSPDAGATSVALMLEVLKNADG